MSESHLLFTSTPCRYVTSHPGQLSLLLSGEWETTTSYGAMAKLFGQNGN